MTGTGRSRQHLPPGGGIADESASPAGTGFQVTQRASLAEDHGLDDYAREGYDVLIVSSAISWRYLAEPSRYPAQVAFYSRLFREGRLLQEFLPSATSRGPVIRIYRIAPAPAPAAPAAPAAR